MIIFTQQFTNQFLRTPSFPLEIAEEVRIGDIRLVCHIVVSFVEDHLQFIDKLFLSAHQFGKAFDIVRDIERVIPGISFMETGTRFKVLPLLRIERRIERAVGQDGTKRTELLAIVMLISHSSFPEQLGVFLLSQSIRQQR